MNRHSPSIHLYGIVAAVYVLLFYASWFSSLSAKSDIDLASDRNQSLLAASVAIRAFDRATSANLRYWEIILRILSTGSRLAAVS
jgi:hypothetical protein